MHEASWMKEQPKGYNPMRWDCSQDGCFNEKRRPKIEVFAECFPGKINFGDVDGIVEISGFFCMLEWKGDGGAIKTGQDITYKRFTKIKGNVVFVVYGNAETMNVYDYTIYWNGKTRVFGNSNLDMVKKRIIAWVEWIKSSNRQRD